MLMRRSVKNVTRADEELNGNLHAPGKDETNRLIIKFKCLPESRNKR